MISSHKILYCCSVHIVCNSDSAGNIIFSFQIIQILLFYDRIFTERNFSLYLSTYRALACMQYLD